ncbi:MAG: glycosyltransferase [Pyrinomonadaceae bacterium]
MANTSKPRILHLIGSFDQGGSESQAVQLTRMLQDRGRYDLYIACLQSTGVLRATVDAFFPRPIPEYPLTSFYDANTVKQLARFRSFLRSNQIEIVQTHDFYTNVFGLAGAALAGIPVRIAARRETSGVRTFAQLRVQAWSYLFAHNIVANAESVRTQLILEGVPATKIVTIYNGLDTTRFSSQSSQTGRELLQQFGLSTNVSHIVTLVANMRYSVKDHPTFLKGAQLVVSKFPDVAFVIAGEGDMRPQFEKLSEELGIRDTVFFVGRCENIPALLCASDVCVLSSRAEGMPNAILEYMAAGKPVVTTKAGGASELIMEGEGGYLVEIGDYAGLAERILAVLSNPRLAQDMGKANKTRVAEKFSVVAQVERIESLYNQLLHRPSQIMVGTE